MDAVRVEKNPKVAARWAGQSLLRFGGLLAIFGMVDFDAIIFVWKI